MSRRIGIGAAVARRLADAGVDVFLHHWEPHDAEQPWGADRGGAQSIADELAATGCASSSSRPTSPIPPRPRR